MFEIPEEIQALVEQLAAGITPEDLKRAGAPPADVREAGKVYKYQRIAEALRSGLSYSRVQAKLKVSAADVAKVSAMLKQVGDVPPAVPTEREIKSTSESASGSGLVPVAQAKKRQPGPRPLSAGTPPAAVKEIAQAKIEIARIKAKETVLLAKLRADEEAAKLAQEQLKQKEKKRLAKEQAQRAEAQRLARERAKVLPKYDKEKEVLDTYFKALAKPAPGTEVSAGNFDHFLEVIAAALDKLGAALQQLGHRHHPVYILGRTIEELLKECREENFIDGSGFFSGGEDKVALDFPDPVAAGSPLVRASSPSFADLVKAFAAYRLK
ncbi:MAG: hypothetical protein MUC97_01565 [Bernardetiaceae bacterium]|jgi:hypothetical protein|nr:hypothetical protein [Bernardetiaceae bacterium]